MAERDHSNEKRRIYTWRNNVFTVVRAVIRGYWEGNDYGKWNLSGEVVGFWSMVFLSIVSFFVKIKAKNR